MSIQAFIDEVSRRLRDDNPDRDCRQWDEGFLLNALNAAFGALCHVKPDAFTEFRDITLVDGHEQEIDADLHRIIEILHNVCRESGQPRRAITKADRGVFDASHPHWRQDASRGYIRHYMRNSITQSKFDVWPPAIAGDIVRGEFTKTPCVSTFDIEEPVAPTPPMPVNTSASPEFFDQALIADGTITGLNFDPNGARVTTTLDASASRTSGKWYWEVEILGIGNNSTAVGMYVGEHTDDQPLGNGILGIGLYHDASSRWNTDNQGGGHPQYGVGDIVSVAADLDDGTFSISVNGGAYDSNATLNNYITNNAASGLVPAFSGLPATEMNVILDPADFTYAPPVDHLPLTETGEVGVDPAEQAAFEAALIEYNEQLLAFQEALDAFNLESFSITDEVPFDKAYHLPLAEFCLYYAYAVDDDVTANSGRAQRHWLAFFQLMNKREDADLIVEQTQENSE